MKIRSSRVAFTLGKEPKKMRKGSGSKDQVVYVGKVGSKSVMNSTLNNTVPQRGHREMK